MSATPKIAALLCAVGAVPHRWLTRPAEGKSEIYCRVCGHVLDIESEVRAIMREKGTP
jgi:hypothetical protein